MVLVGLAVEVFFIPHYAAPLTAINLALVIQALRHLHVWRWENQPAGAFLVRVLPLVYAGALGIRLLAPGLGLPLTETNLWWATLMPSKTRSRARARPGAPRANPGPASGHRSLWTGLRSR